MKNTARLAAFILLAAFVAALPRPGGAVIIRPNAASSPAGTVPSGVNYQGRLVDNGFPVTGLKNVTFRIYDALTGPTNLLQTIGPQTVQVNQGLFSTTISISTQALAGPLQKFLEVQVGAQVLAPREQLNSVPYALVAKSLEENLAISTVTVGSQFISSGTLAVASIQSLNGASYFSIISNAHMSSSTLTLDGNAATALTAVGNVGIGTANPGSKLNVSSGTLIVDGNAATALVLDNSASLPILRFREAGADKGAIKSVGGVLTLDGDTAANRALLLNTNSVGNVGVGAAVPGAKLDVDGNAQFGSPGTKSAIAVDGSLTMAPAAHMSLSGSGGYVTSLSSVNASAFFGNGAGITGVAVLASNVSPGTFQNGTYVFQNNVDFPGTSRWTSAGNTGFGTQSPATKLHMSSGTLTIDGNTAISVVTSGNVGIKGAPTNPLSVTGNANVTGTFTANTMTPTNPLGTQYGGSGQNWSAVAQGAIPFFNGAGTMSTLPANTSGKVLQTQGAGLDPIWASPSVGGATTLTNGTIWIGSNITNIATERTVSGNGTLSNTGVLAITSLPGISGASLTSLTAANISAGTAGINITGNAATATAHAANGANCAAGSFPLGVDASGASESCSTSITGNAATATALAANGANCAAGSFPLGVDASGAVESCSTSITGNAATATTATSATSATSATTAGGITTLAALATIRATTPSAQGQLVFCTNCATSAVCVSTGTTIAGYSDISNRTTPCQ